MHIIIRPEDQVVKSTGQRTSFLRNFYKPSPAVLRRQTRNKNVYNKAAFHTVLNLQPLEDMSPEEQQLCNPDASYIVFFVILHYRIEAADIGYKSTLLGLDQQTKLSTDSEASRLVIMRPAHGGREKIHIEYIGNYVVMRARPCVACQQNGRECDSMSVCNACVREECECNPQPGALGKGPGTWIPWELQGHRCFFQKGFVEVMLCGRYLPPLGDDDELVRQASADKVAELKRTLKGVHVHTLKREGGKVLILGSLPHRDDPALLRDIGFEWDEIEDAEEEVQDEMDAEGQKDIESQMEVEAQAGTQGQVRADAMEID
ncbi:hypothetical protein BT63DRAFT_456402 [Microthyrium microscopicum]|uniref:Uncharacterized protein n=1 Tax=Microthyrium microscopicum TaxID=703497 RepID=A0A6A6UAZ2_9PEZI|nr:hypothetical protein BT63DRAFT_456402 [Microthyrium microscopicum]